MDEDGKNRLDRKSEKLDTSRVGVKVFIECIVRQRQNNWLRHVMRGESLTRVDTVKVEWMTRCRIGGREWWI